VTPSAEGTAAAEPARPAARSEPAPPADQPGAVIALYDGTTAARATVRRALSCGRHTVVVGPEDSAERLGSLADQVASWVPARSAGLREALEIAAAHRAAWVCVPSTAMPSEDLLAAALQFAAERATRGGVLHVVRGPVEDAGPAPYRRVAALADLEETAGVGPYAAARVAASSGADLELVLLDADEGGAPAEEAGGADTLRIGEEVAAAGAVHVGRRHVGASSDPVAAALRQVERLRPDLLVVELGVRRLLDMRPDADPLVGPGAVQAAVASSRGRLVANLLAWLAVDVALVIEPVGGVEASRSDRVLVMSAIDRTLATAQ
jgi:hypothetical protein